MSGSPGDQVVISKGWHRGRTGQVVAADGDAVQVMLWPTVQRGNRSGRPALITVRSTWVDPISEEGVA